jgi:dTDP-4-amino-4,6-dideoxygalactose transaminase
MAEKKIYLMRPFVGDEELDAVRHVFASKYLTEGPVTQEFEKRFADFVGAKHAIAVTSCMTGLELALKTLGILPGDEVIVPSFTHPATGDCVYQVGADAVLVDVDLSSFNMSPQALENAITARTRGIIPVSWAGNPIDPEIYAIGKERGIPVIEDAACSAGAELHGGKVGSLAPFSCFSFHPRKILTTGEGGMVTTNDSRLAEKAIALKHFGQTKDGSFRYHGTNYKMSNIAAAIGLEQLKKLPGILKDRIQRANRYSDLLQGIPGIKVPHVKSGIKHVFQTYCIYIDVPGMRDELRTDLAKKGIETQIGTYALHLEPSYAGVKCAGSLKNSELLFYNLLALPLHHELTDQDQDYVVQVLHGLMKNYRGSS